MPEVDRLKSMLTPGQWNELVACYLIDQKTIPFDFGDEEES